MEVGTIKPNKLYGLIVGTRTRRSGTLSEFLAVSSAQYMFYRMRLVVQVSLR
jgi:hypothetical protein